MPSGRDKFVALSRIYLAEGAPVPGSSELDLWPEREDPRTGKTIPADTVTRAQLHDAGQTDENIRELIEQGALEAK